MDKAAEIPIFAYPTKFAEISELSAKEIRKMCREKIIPCEKSARGFRIYVHGALDILRNRAMDFAGHKGVAVTIYQPLLKGPRRKDKGFLAALDNLRR